MEFPKTYQKVKKFIENSMEECSINLYKSTKVIVQKMHVIVPKIAGRE